MAFSLAFDGSHLGSPLSISWDASKGKAPWTVLIAPINQLPATLEVLAASGSDFSIDWPVPAFSKSLQALVAVADATGEAAGVSSLFSISSGSSSCSAPSSALDFVWYATDTKSDPKQCKDWDITYQADTDNAGIEGAVSFTFLPEEGTPVKVSAGTTSGKSNKFSWTVPFDAGTKFAVAASDGGKTGTGGVGDLYTVAKGSSTTCRAVGMFGNGLPTATETAAASSSSSAASSSSSASKGKSSGSKSTSSVASSVPTFGGNDSAASEKSGSGSTAGTAVGATVGVIGALAVLALILWFLRRRRRREITEKQTHGGGSGGDGLHAHPVSPWRYSAAPYGDLQTNSRTKRWFQRHSSSAQGSFKVLSAGTNDDGNGHARTGSFTSSSQPTVTGQQTTLRSAPHNRDEFALSTIASSGMLSDDARSSIPSNRSPPAPYSSQQFINTVPDASLFPPPPPAPPTKGPYSKDPPGKSPFDDPSTPLPGQPGAGVGSYQGLMRSGNFDGDGSRYPAPIRYDVTRGEPQRQGSVSRARGMSSSSSYSPGSGNVARKLAPSHDGAGQQSMAPGQFYAPGTMQSNGSRFDPYNAANGPERGFSNHPQEAPRPAPAPPMAGQRQAQPPVVSEVLMMEAPEYKGRVAAANGKHTAAHAAAADDDDEDGALPYL